MTTARGAANDERGPLADGPRRHLQRPPLPRHGRPHAARSHGRRAPSLDADILALQEVIGAGPAGGGHAELLGAALGMGWVMAPPRQLRGALFGNVVLSRFPVRHHAQYDLSWKTCEPRCCQRVDLDLDGALLHLYNVHLGTAYLERRFQAQRLPRSSSDRRVPGAKVVLGDFNEWMRGLATTLLSERLQAIDLSTHLRRRRTYPGLFPILQPRSHLLSGPRRGRRRGAPAHAQDADGVGPPAAGRGAEDTLLIARRSADRSPPSESARPPFDPRRSSKRESPTALAGARRNPGRPAASYLPTGGDAVEAGAGVGDGRELRALALRLVPCSPAGARAWRSAPGAATCSNRSPPGGVASGAEVLVVPVDVTDRAAVIAASDGSSRRGAASTSPCSTRARTRRRPERGFDSGQFVDVMTLNYFGAALRDRGRAARHAAARTRTYRRRGEPGRVSRTPDGSGVRAPRRPP